MRDKNCLENWWLTIAIRYPVLGLSVVVFYPAFQWPMVVVNLLKTIVNAVINPNRMDHYHQYYATAVHFYYTIDDVFRRFGRYGETRLLTCGEPFYLGELFHFSAGSLRLFQRMGHRYQLLCFALYSLITVAAIIFSDSPWFLLFILLLNNLAFYCFFYMSNYNLMGGVMLFVWLLLVVGETGFQAVFVAILVAYFSFTFAVMMLGVGAWLSLVSFSYEPFLLALPAAVLLFRNFIMASKDRNLLTLLKRVKSGLGSSQKYHRAVSRFAAWEYKQLAVLMIFPATLFFINGEFILMSLLAPGFFLCNKLLRFADEVTLMLFALLLNSVIIISAPEAMLLLGFVFFALVPPGIFAFSWDPRANFFLPALKPQNFALKTLFVNYVKDMQPGQRILFAARDPKQNYHQLFGVFRDFVCVIQALAAKQDVLLFSSLWREYLHINQMDAPNYFYKDIADINRVVHAVEPQLIFCYEVSVVEKLVSESGFEIKECIQFPKAISQIEYKSQYEFPDLYLLKRGAP